MQFLVFTTGGCLYATLSMGLFTLKLVNNKQATRYHDIKLDKDVDILKDREEF